MGSTFLLSGEALLDAQFSVALGSDWLWHPSLPCVPTAVALPRVPADGAISPCHSGLWWHGEPDGHLSPPCKNGFLSLQPNQSLPHLVNHSGVGKAVPVRRGCDVQMGMSSWRGVGG